MRRAKPHELSDHIVPVMTARLTEAELAQWFPIRFRYPSPRAVRLYNLGAGAYIVLNYGRISNQLTVEAPESMKDRSGLITAFFREVPLPIARVLWYRPNVRLPKKSADSP